MAAGPRVFLTLPGGEDEMRLTKDKGDAIGVQFIERDGSVRDLTSDTLAVAAKLDTTAKTLAFVADSPATAGKATLTIPAAQLAAAGVLYVDLLWNKSGGPVTVVGRLKFTVEDSDAD